MVDEPAAPTAPAPDVGTLEKAKTWLNTLDFNRDGKADIQQVTAWLKDQPENIRKAYIDAQKTLKGAGQKFYEVAEPAVSGAGAAAGTIFEQIGDFFGKNKVAAGAAVITGLIGMATGLTEGLGMIGTLLLALLAFVVASAVGADTNGMLSGMFGGGAKSEKSGAGAAPTITPTVAVEPTPQLVKDGKLTKAGENPDLAVTAGDAKIFVEVTEDKKSVRVIELAHMQDVDGKKVAGPRAGYLGDTIEIKLDANGSIPADFAKQVAAKGGPKFHDAMESAKHYAAQTHMLVSDKPPREGKIEAALAPLGEITVVRNGREVEVMPVLQGTYNQADRSVEFTHVQLQLRGGKPVGVVEELPPGSPTAGQVVDGKIAFGLSKDGLQNYMDDFRDRAQQAVDRKSKGAAPADGLTSNFSPEVINAVDNMRNQQVSSNTNMSLPRSVANTDRGLPSGLS